MSSTPQGVVLASAWLTEQGYSLDLQKRYRKSNWLRQLERGALIRDGDKVDVLGGLYALGGARDVGNLNLLRAAARVTVERIL